MPKSTTVTATEQGKDDDLQTTITPSVAPVTSAKLDNPAMRHGFFTRAGGVSTGLYTGLNTGLGSDDARDAVHENRRRIAAFLGLGPTAIAGCHQIHSPDVVTVTQGTDLQARPKADALVTAAPNIGLSIQTADCGPVLFADQQAGIIGAAHAGWKGAVSGILENTIAAMQALGAKRKNIIAVLGPTISQANYEVGPEFADRLTDIDAGNSQFMIGSTKADHLMFDLPAFILQKLQACGIADAVWTGQCTYADEAHFFSYRRTTHRGESDYGRQTSMIMIHQPKEA